MEQSVEEDSLFPPLYATDVFREFESQFDDIVGLAPNHELNIYSEASMWPMVPYQSSPFIPNTDKGNSNAIHYPFTQQLTTPTPEMEMVISDEFSRDNTSTDIFTPIPISLRDLPTVHSWRQLVEPLDDFAAITLRPSDEPSHNSLSQTHNSTDTDNDLNGIDTAAPSQILNATSNNSNSNSSSHHSSSDHDSRSHSYQHHIQPQPQPQPQTDSGESSECDYDLSVDNDSVTATATVTTTLTTVTTQPKQTNQNLQSQLGDYRTKYDPLFDQSYHPQNDSQLPWICSHIDCTNTKKRTHFRTKQLLAKHYRRHTEFAFKCNICNRAFARKTNLADHSRVHSGEKPFKCQICQQTFQQCHSLQTHMRIHSGEKPFRCPHCGKQFAVEYSLQSHTQNIHSSDRPTYQCDICSKEYKSKSGLRIHRKTKHNHTQ